MFYSIQSLGSRLFTLFKAKTKLYFFLSFVKYSHYRKEYIFDKKYVFKLLFSNTKPQVSCDVEVILIDKAHTFRLLISFTLNFNP